MRTPRPLRSEQELLPRAWDVVAQLHQWLQGTQPEVYADAFEFLWDWYPDFPWNMEEAAIVASLILRDDALRHTVRAFDVVCIEAKYSEERFPETPLAEMLVEPALMRMACLNEE